MPAIDEILEEDTVESNPERILYLAEYPPNQRYKLRETDHIELNTGEKLGYEQLISFISNNPAVEFNIEEDYINEIMPGRLNDPEWREELELVVSRAQTLGFESLEPWERKFLSKTGAVSIPEYDLNNIRIYNRTMEVKDYHDDPDTYATEYPGKSFPGQANWWFDATGYEGREPDYDIDAGGSYGFYGPEEAYDAIKHFYEDLEEGESYNLVLGGHAGDYGTFGGTSPKQFEEIMDRIETEFGTDNKINDVVLHSCYMGDNELACGMLSESFDAPVTGQTGVYWGTDAMNKQALSDPNANLLDKSFVKGADHRTFNPGFHDTVDKMIEEQEYGGKSYAVSGSGQQLHTMTPDEAVNKRVIRDAYRRGSISYDEYITSVGSYASSFSDDLKLKVTEMINKGYSKNAVSNYLELIYAQQTPEDQIPSGDVRDDVYGGSQIVGPEGTAVGMLDKLDIITTTDEMYSKYGKIGGFTNPLHPSKFMPEPKEIFNRMLED